jgi:hypothetical protein
MREQEDHNHMTLLLPSDLLSGGNLKSHVFLDQLCLVYLHGYPFLFVRVHETTLAADG